MRLSAVLVLSAGAAAQGQCTPSETRFCITVGQKTSSNPNPGGEDVCYYVNGVESPALTLLRGQTYQFQMNGVSSSHPFYLSTSVTGSGSGAYTTGVTPPGPVWGTQVKTFIVPASAPAVLYYQCAEHSRMGWRINIVDGCYANCDGSTTPPLLNVNDFVCFQTRFAAGDPWANCDSSTGSPALNVNDFVCFQTRFAAGCP